MSSDSRSTDSGPPVSAAGAVDGADAAAGGAGDAAAGAAAVAAAAASDRASEGADAACHNCGAPLHGRFCAACGQEAKPLNPRVRDILRDLLEELSDVDGRVFRSVRRLFLSPGYLTREQFLGRRVSWLAPLRLYLLFSVLYFAAASFADATLVRVNITTSRSAPNAATAEQGQGQPADDEAAAFKRADYANAEEFRAAFRTTWMTWVPRVMFLLVPVFAGLVALVRRGSRLGYPLHVYFALHLHATWFGLSALAATGYLWSPTLAETLGSLRTIYILVYLYRALRTTYGISRRRALLDATVLTVSYLIVIVAVMAAIFLPLLLPLLGG